MPAADASTPAAPVPRPHLGHLRRLTDDTGMIQHALGPVPNRATGYTADDNARALLVCLEAIRAGDREAEELAGTYLAFLAWALGPDGWFHNNFSYDRRPLPEEPSEDCQGRCLWALAAAARHWAGTSQGRAAARFFQQGLAAAPRLRHVRGRANLVVALAEWLGGEDGAEGAGSPAEGPARAAVEDLLRQAAGALVRAWETCRGPGWEWFEDCLTYDNAMLPYALLRAARVTGDRRYREAGLATLEFLAGVTFRNGLFWAVGNKGWYPRGGQPAPFDQQPVEAGTTVLACLEAWRLTGDPGWAERAVQAGLWFTGRNALGLSLYDPDTGGCRDGLRERDTNPNQGAESTLAWLWAAYALHAQPLPITQPARR